MQSPDSAGGVHVAKDYPDVGAGDHIMFGCASDETEDTTPLMHLMAARLGGEIERRAQEW